MESSKGIFQLWKKKPNVMIYNEATISKIRKEGDVSRYIQGLDRYGTWKDNFKDFRYKAMSIDAVKAESKRGVDVGVQTTEEENAAHSTKNECDLQNFAKEYEPDVGDEENKIKYEKVIQSFDIGVDFPDNKKYEGNFQSSVNGNETYTDENAIKNCNIGNEKAFNDSKLGCDLDVLVREYNTDIKEAHAQIKFQNVIRDFDIGIESAAEGVEILLSDSEPILDGRKTTVNDFDILATDYEVGIKNDRKNDVNEENKKDFIFTALTNEYEKDIANALNKINNKELESMKMLKDYEHGADEPLKHIQKGKNPEENSEDNLEALAKEYEKNINETAKSLNEDYRLHEVFESLESLGEFNVQLISRLETHRDSILKIKHDLESKTFFLSSQSQFEANPQEMEGNKLIKVFRRVISHDNEEESEVLADQLKNVLEEDSGKIFILEKDGIANSDPLEILANEYENEITFAVSNICSENRLKELSENCGRNNEENETNDQYQCNLVTLAYNLNIERTLNGMSEERKLNEVYESLEGLAEFNEKLKSTSAMHRDSIVKTKQDFEKRKMSSEKPRMEYEVKQHKQKSNNKLLKAFRRFVSLDETENKSISEQFDNALGLEMTTASEMHFSPTMVNDFDILATDYKVGIENSKTKEVNEETNKNDFNFTALTNDYEKDIANAVKTIHNKELESMKMLKDTKLMREFRRVSSHDNEEKSQELADQLQNVLENDSGNISNIAMDGISNSDSLKILANEYEIEISKAVSNIHSENSLNKLLSKTCERSIQPSVSNEINETDDSDQYMLETLANKYDLCIERTLDRMSEEKKLNEVYESLESLAEFNEQLKSRLTMHRDSFLKTKEDFAKRKLSSEKPRMEYEVKQHKQKSNNKFVRAFRRFVSLDESENQCIAKQFDNALVFGMTAASEKHFSPTMVNDFDVLATDYEVGIKNSKKKEVNEETNKKDSNFKVLTNDYEKNIANAMKTIHNKELESMKMLKDYEHGADEPLKHIQKGSKLEGICEDNLEALAKEYEKNVNEAAKSLHEDRKLHKVSDSLGEFNVQLNPRLVTQRESILKIKHDLESKMPSLSAHSQFKAKPKEREDTKLIKAFKRVISHDNKKESKELVDQLQNVFEQGSEKTSNIAQNGIINSDSLEILANQYENEVTHAVSNIYSENRLNELSENCGRNNEESETEEEDQCNLETLANNYDLSIEMNLNRINEEKKLQEVYESLEDLAEFNEQLKSRLTMHRDSVVKTKQDFAKRKLSSEKPRMEYEMRQHKQKSNNKFLRAFRRSVSLDGSKNNPISHHDFGLGLTGLSEKPFSETMVNDFDSFATDNEENSREKEVSEEINTNFFNVKVLTNDYEKDIANAVKNIHSKELESMKMLKDYEHGDDQPLKYIQKEEPDENGEDNLETLASEYEMYVNGAVKSLHEDQRLNEVVESIETIGEVDVPLNSRLGTQRDSILKIKHDLESKMASLNAQSQFEARPQKRKDMKLMREFRRVSSRDNEEKSQELADQLQNMFEQDSGNRFIITKDAIANSDSLEILTNEYENEITLAISNITSGNRLNKLLSKNCERKTKPTVSNEQNETDDDDQCMLETLANKYDLRIERTLTKISEEKKLHEVYESLDGFSEFNEQLKSRLTMHRDSIVKTKQDFAKRKLSSEKPRMEYEVKQQKHKSNNKLVRAFRRFVSLDESENQRISQQFDNALGLEITAAVSEKHFPETRSVNFNILAKDYEIGIDNAIKDRVNEEIRFKSLTNECENDIANSVNKIRKDLESIEMSYDYEYGGDQSLKCIQKESKSDENCYYNLVTVAKEYEMSIEDALKSLQDDRKFLEVYEFLENLREFNVQLNSRLVTHRDSILKIKHDFESAQCFRNTQAKFEHKSLKVKDKFCREDQNRSKALSQPSKILFDHHLTHSNTLEALASEYESEISLAVKNIHSEVSESNSKQENEPYDECESKLETVVKEYDLIIECAANRICEEKKHEVHESLDIAGASPNEYELVIGDIVKKNADEPSLETLANDYENEIAYAFRKLTEDAINNEKQFIDENSENQFIDENSGENNLESRAKSYEVNLQDVLKRMHEEKKLWEVNESLEGLSEFNSNLNSRLMVHKDSILHIMEDFASKKSSGRGSCLAEAGDSNSVSIAAQSENNGKQQIEKAPSNQVNLHKISEQKVEYLFHNVSSRNASVVASTPASPKSKGELILGLHNHSPIRPERRKRARSLPVLNPSQETILVDLKGLENIIVPQSLVQGRFHNTTVLKRNSRTNAQDRDIKPNNFLRKSSSFSVCLKELNTNEQTNLSSIKAVESPITPIPVIRVKIPEHSTKRLFNRKKSHTFTSGDRYMKAIKGNISIGNKTQSLSKLIRRTLSFKDVGHQDSPPCLPNLMNRFRRKKKLGKYDKNKLSVIREDNSLHKSDTAESFASIFIPENEDETFTPHFEPYLSCSLLFSRSLESLKRSMSNLEISSLGLEGLFSTSHKKVRKLKRSQSWLSSGHFVKICNEDSSVSLHPEASKRIHELLGKPFCKMSCGNPNIFYRPDNSPGRLSLNIGAGSNITDENCAFDRFRSERPLEKGTFRDLEIKRFNNNPLQIRVCESDIPLQTKVCDADAPVEICNENGPLNVNCNTCISSGIDYHKDFSGETKEILKDISDKITAMGAIPESHSMVSCLSESDSITTTENQNCIKHECGKIKERELHSDTLKQISLQISDIRINNLDLHEKRIQNFSNKLSYDGETADIPTLVTDSSEQEYETNNDIRECLSKSEDHSSGALFKTNPEINALSECKCSGPDNDSEQNSYLNKAVNWQVGPPIEEVFCNSNDCDCAIGFETKILYGEEIGFSQIVNDNAGCTSYFLPTSIPSICINDTECVETYVDGGPEIDPGKENDYANKYAGHKIGSFESPLLYVNPKDDKPDIDSNIARNNSFQNSLISGGKPATAHPASLEAQTVMQPKVSLTERITKSTASSLQEEIPSSENMSHFDISKVVYRPSNNGSESWQGCDNSVGPSCGPLLSPLLSPILSVRETQAENGTKIVHVCSPSMQRKFFISSVKESYLLPLQATTSTDGDDTRLPIKSGEQKVLELENAMENSNDSQIHSSHPLEAEIECKTCDENAVMNGHGIPDEEKLKVPCANDVQNSFEYGINDAKTVKILEPEGDTGRTTLKECHLADNMCSVDAQGGASDSSCFRETSSPGPQKPVIRSFLPKKEEEAIPQKDRSIEVYPETLRQRQRSMPPSPNKVDIKNWEPSSGVSNEIMDGKKFLPSVKALRNQFENGNPAGVAGNYSSTPSPQADVTNFSGISSSDPSSSSEISHAGVQSPRQSVTSEHEDSSDEDGIDPIFTQFRDMNNEMKHLLSQPPSTIGWNPQPLIKKLYYIPEVPKIQSNRMDHINIEGYLEKLPSGRKKATFWNAWKRRYFVAKDGILYYYQNKDSEKPGMRLTLMGGKVEVMDNNLVAVDDKEKELRSGTMLGIDDGKGHYIVVRCITRQEASRWKSALETHIAEDFSGHFVQPWPIPTNPSMLRDTIILDIGSCNVRAGILASQPTLPEIFFPSVVSVNRESRTQTWGAEALLPHARNNASLKFPIRPSHKISKFSMDLNAVSSLLQKIFSDLNVDPKHYNIQFSVPRVLNHNTQTELIKLLFDKFGVKAVNLTHQSILALYAYNATSGIVVDIGERIDVVPVTEGYIVDGGVSRVPYGGYRILEHLRNFLLQKNLSLVNQLDNYVIRQVLETVCYCALHYNTEKQRCSMNPESFEELVPFGDIFPKSPQYEIFHNISLEFGRFQATEGLFNPDAWGLDHPGLHKLVHKAIRECSMDIRKEMSRSIFLAGGVSQLPGLSERLSRELDNLTPPAISPKVHASPYRYHAAYLGSCVLAESSAYSESKISKDEWQKLGNAALRKWTF